MNWPWASNGWHFCEEDYPVWPAPELLALHLDARERRVHATLHCALSVDAVGSACWSLKHVVPAPYQRRTVHIAQVAFRF